MAIGGWAVGEAPIFIKSPCGHVGITKYRDAAPQREHGEFGDLLVAEFHPIGEHRISEQGKAMMEDPAGWALQHIAELKAENERLQSLGPELAAAEGHCETLRGRIAKLEAELAEAYDEMRKQWPAITGVYNRAVWQKAGADG